MVTSSNGASNCSIDASDSPSLPLICVTAVLSAVRTTSRLAASTCTCAKSAPVAQLVAVRPMTYLAPSRLTDPAMAARPPARAHASRALSGLTGSPDVRPISVRICAMRRSGMMFRNGDCSRPTASPCRSVSSKIGSPVEFEKPVRTTESRSVSASTRRERPSHADMDTTMPTTTATPRTICPRGNARLVGAPSAIAAAGTGTSVWRIGGLTGPTPGGCAAAATVGAARSKAGWYAPLANRMTRGSGRPSSA